jgi:hypothetical protein
MYHSSNHPPTHPPTQPRNGRGNKRKVSQRGMLSIAMLLVSVGALGSAMLGGAKMVFDILGENPSSIGVASKVIVIGIAYLVGWLTAMVAIRVYGNLVLPILINWFIVGCLLAVCFLYIEILQRLFLQQYDFWKFIKYVVVMGAGLSAMVGLHLIVEDHNLRPFSLPLLIISLIQLGLIVYRYVFTESVNFSFLWMDLFFFFGMSVFSISMLAHFGMLDPLRAHLTNYFDMNSTSIRTKD